MKRNKFLRMALYVMIGTCLSVNLLAGTGTSALYRAAGSGVARARYAAWEPQAALEGAGKTVIMQRNGGQTADITLTVQQNNAISEVPAKFSYAFTRDYPAAATGINASSGWMRLDAGSGYGNYSTAGTVLTDTLLYGVGPRAITFALRFDKDYAKDNKPAAVGNHYYEKITLDWLAEQVD